MQPLPSSVAQYSVSPTTSACSLPSVGDCSNIILGVLWLNHKKQDKFKDNIIKQKVFGEDEEQFLPGNCKQE